jgi:hypothetical protein
MAVEAGHWEIAETMNIRFKTRCTTILLLCGICVLLSGCAGRNIRVEHFDNQKMIHSLLSGDNSTLLQNGVMERAKYSPEQLKAVDRIYRTWDALLADLLEEASIPCVVTLLMQLDAAGNITSIEVTKSDAPKQLLAVCKQAVEKSAPFDLKGMTSFTINFKYVGF